MYEFNGPNAVFVKFCHDYGKKQIDTGNLLEKEFANKIFVIRKELSTCIKKAIKDEAKLKADYKKVKSDVEKAKKKDTEDKQKCEQVHKQLSKATDGKKRQALEKEADAAAERAKKSEKEYEASVKVLETHHSEYYANMSKLLNQLEAQDCKRIQTMQWLMSRYSVVQMELAAALLQSAEKMKGSYDNINMKKETVSFIKDYQTNQTIPPPDAFEPYQMDIISRSRPTSIKVEEPAPSAPVVNDEKRTAYRQSMVGLSTDITPNTKVLRRVKVLYEFEPQATDDLPLAIGSIIDVLEVTDDGWWIGSHNGIQGFFPSNFVETLEDENEPKAGPESPQQEPLYAVVKFEYTAQGSDELSIQPGENLEILIKSDDGWWHAKNKETGKVGLIPGNYVEEIQ